MSTVAADEKRKYDPFSKEAMEDPFELYRWLRDNHPIYFVPEYEMWVVSQFQDIWDLLSDTNLPIQARESTVWNRQQMLQLNGGEVPDDLLESIGTFTQVDPPFQGELRNLVNRPLRPIMVSRIEEWFRDLVKSELPDLLARGTFNMTAEFGKWSSASMAKFSGMPREFGYELLARVNEQSELLGNPPEDFDPYSFDGIQKIGLEAIRLRRAAGADGSLPMLDGAINGLFRGKQLNDDQIMGQLFPVLIGGVETLPKITAHGLWELAKAPEQLAEVRSDLANNVAPAFDEMTRYCGPAQWFGRTAIETFDFKGHTIEKGHRIMYLGQSAARDPREFPEPDKFIWNRKAERSLAFGLGDHFCIGIHLARMEARVLLEEFLSTVEEYEVDEVNAERSVSSFQKGWDTLPVTIKSYRDADGVLQYPVAAAASSISAKE